MAHKVEVRAEQPRLAAGLCSQFCAAYPPRETEVVADQRAGARLATKGYRGRVRRRGLRDLTSVTSASIHSTPWKRATLTRWLPSITK
jgi:hypothetical protein